MASLSQRGLGIIWMDTWMDGFDGHMHYSKGRPADGLLSGAYGSPSWTYLPKWNTQNGQLRYDGGVHTTHTTSMARGIPRSAPSGGRPLVIICPASAAGGAAAELSVSR